MVEQDGVTYYSGKEIEIVLRRSAELYGPGQVADIADLIDFLGKTMGAIL